MIKKDAVNGGILSGLDFRNYTIYSPEETIKRAKERIGEEKYNLIFNNCEHFAIWCKTGVSESNQVKKVIRNVSGAGTTGIIKT